MAASYCRGKKFAVNFLDDCPLLFVERAAQHVGPAGRQSRKRLADLQNMLLIDDQPVGAFQTASSEGCG